MFKYLKDNSVLISAILVFIAAAKLYFYYIDFNINIIEYLTLGELLTSIFDDMYIYLSLVILVLIQSLASGLFFKFMKSNNHIKKFEHSMNSIDVDYKFLGTLIFTLGIATYVKVIDYNVNLIWIYFILLGALQTAMLWPDFIRRFEEGEKTLSNTEALNILILVFILFSLFMSRFEVAKARRQVSNVKVIGQDTITCNKQTNLIYLGKTQEYFFIYNATNKTSQAIKSDEIKIIQCYY